MEQKEKDNGCWAWDKIGREVGFFRRDEKKSICIRNKERLEIKRRHNEPAPF